MSEQTNAERVAEAWRVASARRGVIERLEQENAALERDLEELSEELDHHQQGHMAEYEKAAALAAVVEKVREEAVGTQRDADLGNWADELLDILAAAPADVLAEHDAALIEGLADEAQHQNRMLYPWLREKARQKREGQT